MTRLSGGLALIALIQGAGGCAHSHPTDQQTTLYSTSQPARENRISGAMRFREGTLPPQQMTVIITVKRESFHGILVEHRIDDIRSWPARFDFPMKWPLYKDTPAPVTVSARGFINGRFVFIAPEQMYLPGPWRDEDMHPDLVFVPATE